jgi:hypothetical protein
VFLWHFARAAAGVESRRCRCDGDGDDYDSDKPSYDKLFVFGDSFADAGNLPKGDLKWETRGWYGTSPPACRTPTTTTTDRPLLRRLGSV